jgi:long-chain acyl-CoA synthetase
MTASMLNKFGENKFLRDEVGRSVYYHEVISLAHTQEFKDTSRCLVFCILDNSVDGIAGYAALLAANAVPMMIGSNISSSSLDDLVALYSPDYIYLSESVKLDWIGFKLLFRYKSYVLISLNNIRNVFPLHDDLCLLLSTSGSTGTGKYVRLSHQNIWSNAAAIAEYLSLNAGELPITTLPPSYSYGLSVIHSHLWVGAGLAVTNKTFFDREFWDFLREVEATSLAGVPYNYEILKKLRFTKMELPHLRTLTQAGGRMNPDLTQEFANHCQNKGMRFFTMYGQTEASPRISFVPAEQAFAKAGAIGIPIPGGTIELLSETGDLITDTHIPGELVYRGLNVCLGYAECRADLSLGDMNSGILYTGDLAERDYDGYYRIVGRKKRFIKLFGNRINLQDVELQLSGTFTEVACSGRDDVLEIYIDVCSKDQAPEIKKAVMVSLGVAAQGVTVYEVEKLPRNESGKVRYSELHPEKARRIA